LEKTDILIIGAGVIGLACARELSRSRKSVVLAEKHGSFGQETSSRNSEVIHAGMYYPSNTLKTKLCLDGRRLLYQLCIKQRIPYRKTGKLILATEKDEIPALEAILAQGHKNGVEGLELLTERQIKQYEPELTGVAAVYSAETGIIDSHKFLTFLEGESRANGVAIVYKALVTGIESRNGGYKVSVNNCGETVEIQATTVINCAGLDSDNVAAMAGIDIYKENYLLHYCKGQYFRVSSSKAKLLSHLAYPVPRPKSAGLGVHATLDLAGGLRLGPDDHYLENRIKDYSVDENSKEDFYQSAVKFIPFLKREDLSTDLSGIRPKLQPKGGEFRDFIIRGETDKGLPGLINLIGIESPGLTASLAIAAMVKAICSDLS
jgi:L-2-hydroxyglutarate oxidase LhgO